jgi:hypothetical protein
MIARQRQRPWTRACNDNGLITPPQEGMGLPPTILRVAAETAGPIALSYVADGVLIISRG